MGSTIRLKLRLKDLCIGKPLVFHQLNKFNITKKGEFAIESKEASYLEMRRPVVRAVRSNERGSQGMHDDIVNRLYNLSFFNHALHQNRVFLVHYLPYPSPL